MDPCSDQIIAVKPWVLAETLLQELQHCLLRQRQFAAADLLRDCLQMCLCLLFCREIWGRRIRRRLCLLWNAAELLCEIVIDRTSEIRLLSSALRRLAVQLSLILRTDSSG